MILNAYIFKCNQCGTEHMKPSDELPAEWMQLKHGSPISPIISDKHFCSMECLYDFSLENYNAKGVTK